jgi:citrate synthase
MQSASQKVLRGNNQRAFSTALKRKMEEKIPEAQHKLIAFRKEHAATKIGDITVGSVIGGMRGMMGMLYETSKLHHIDGINYRGKDLYEIR